MTMLQAFLSGLKAADSSVRMVLLLYGITLLLVLPSSFAFQSVVTSAFEGSMMSERMVGGFDFTTYDDFMANHGDALGGIFRQVRWIIFVYTLFSIFLAGGVLSSLRQGEFAMASFFKGCGEFAFRFLRLWLFAGVVIAVAAAVWFVAAGIITAVVSGGAETEQGTVVGFLVIAGLTLIPLGLVLAILDYTKIIIVAEDRKSVVKTFWEGTKFVFRNFWAVGGLQVLFLLVLSALVVLYWLLEDQIGMVSAGTIAVMFVVQQMAVGVRSWVKVWVYGSELALYQGRSVVEIGAVRPFVLRTPAEPATALPTGVDEPRTRVAGKRRAVKPRKAAKRSKTR